MSDLLTRLRAAQVPQESFAENVAEWNLAMLRQERIAFGTKHYNKTYEEVWYLDQQWVIFIVQRYATSQKPEHKKFIRYVELMLDDVEGERIQRPALPRANLTPLAAQSKAAAKAKAKAAAGSPYPNHMFEEDDAELELEPIGLSYTPITTSDVNAMQDRIVFLESTLQQVINQVTTMSQATNPDNH